MANAKKWSNVAIAMESARAAAQVITGITKAAPGVVTTSGTLPTNGAYVLLEIEGMAQLNGMVYRVMGATGTTFQLVDVDGAALDTTNYDTFSSGTFSVITLATSITTATTVSPSGGDFEEIDITTIHDTQRKTIPGLPSAMSYSMDHIWDVANAGLQALNEAYKANAKRVIMFTFGTGGPKMIFEGNVGAHLAPGGQSQGLVTTNTVFTLSGFPMYYTS